MPKETEYKEIYEKFINYQESVHLKNQKRIQVGLKVNILLPLLFLILSFAISNGKLVFLILWIISLFGIAGYLIYVEFSDYKMIKKMEEFGISDIKEGMEANLIGESIQLAENLVNEKLDYADEKMEEGKIRIAREIEEKRERIKEIATQKSPEQEEDSHEKHN